MVKLFIFQPPTSPVLARGFLWGGNHPGFRPGRVRLPWPAPQPKSTHVLSKFGSQQGVGEMGGPTPWCTKHFVWGHQQVTGLKETTGGLPNLKGNTTVHKKGQAYLSWLEIHGLETKSEDWTCTTRSAWRVVRWIPPPPSFAEAPARASRAIHPTPSPA